MVTENSKWVMYNVIIQNARWVVNTKNSDPWWQDRRYVKKPLTLFSIYHNVILTYAQICTIVINGVDHVWSCFMYHASLSDQSGLSSINHVP